MHLPLSFLLSFSLLSAALQAQASDSLKKILLREAARYFHPTGEMSFTISGYDLFKDKPLITPSVPSTPERIKELKKKIRKTWEDAAVWNEIGQIYKRLGKAPEADSCFFRAMFMLEPELKKKPGDKDLNTIAAMILMNREDISGSIDAFNKVLKTDPNDTMANMAVPMLLIRKGDLEAAVEWSREQTEKHPNLPYGYMFHFIAKAFETLGKTGTWSETFVTYYGPKKPEEIFDFTVVSKLKWKEEGFGEQKVLYYGLRILAYVYKGYLVTKPGLKSMQINEEDRKELREIEKFLLSLKADPSYRNLYALNKMLGMVYIVLNEYPRASEYFTEAIKLFPVKSACFDYNPAESYQNLYTLNLMMGDTIGAEKSLRKKIDAQPAIDPLPSDFVWLASIYTWKNDEENTLKYCREALKLDPKNGKAHIGLAVHFILKGDYKNASLELDLAYKHDPGSGASVYALAGIQAMLEGNKSMAKDLFRNAAELNPYDEFTAYALKHYF